MRAISTSIAGFARRVLPPRRLAFLVMTVLSLPGPWRYFDVADRCLGSIAAFRFQCISSHCGLCVTGKHPTLRGSFQRWVFLCALIIAASPAPAQEPPATETEVAYETELRGVTGEIKDLITKSANLYRLKDKPPSSVPALRARVDADLDIIEKILRSEGYYGFRLEQEIDSRARPVKVRIDVDPGPIYQLRTFTIRYEDDRPGRILLTNPYALGILPGERARSQAIVDAEAKLVR